MDLLGGDVEPALLAPRTPHAFRRIVEKRAGHVVDQSRHAARHVVDPADCLVVEARAALLGDVRLRESGLHVVAGLERTHGLRESNLRDPRMERGDYAAGRGVVTRGYHDP